MSAPGPDAPTHEPECWVVDHPEDCDCGVDPDRVYERGVEDGL